MVARASELLGVRGDQVDWARQRVWVVSKGSRVLEPVPASPEAMQHLAAYFHEHGTPRPDDLIWRALAGKPRPLNYHAARRVLQRANAVLGTDWSLHDLRRSIWPLPGQSLAVEHPELAGCRFTPHDFRRLFATDLVNHGLPIHIGAALLGHLDVQTTHGYVTVFQEDVIRHYQTHLAGRRAARAVREYRAPTATEWAEFEEHFDKRKV